MYLFRQFLQYIEHSENQVFFVRIPFHQSSEFMLPGS